MLKRSKVWTRLATCVPRPAAEQYRCITTAVGLAERAVGEELPVYNLDIQQARHSRILGHSTCTAPISSVLETMKASQVGTTRLPADIFGFDVRKDILQQVVRWQQSKKQQVRLCKALCLACKGGQWT